MLVFANCLALFLSGAGVGASIAEWHFGAGSWTGSLAASLLIGVIAAGNLRKTFARSKSSSQ
jgi:membrane protein implicated in regulation of membrane protease activity